MLTSEVLRKAKAISETTRPSGVGFPCVTVAIDSVERCVDWDAHLRADAAIDVFAEVAFIPFIETRRISVWRWYEAHRGDRAYFSLLFARAAEVAEAREQAGAPVEPAPVAEAVRP